MNDNYHMSDHKLYWHLERVQQWLDGKEIAPLYIDMGITQTCNIACKYCYYATPKNRSDKMIPKDALIRFLHDCAEMGVKAIGFLGDGEPMIHPDVYEVVMAGTNFGVDMAISTNGVIMNEEGMDDFLKALTWIRFNISAATPEKYEEVMGVPRLVYARVVDNIKKCIELKHKLNLKVTIGIQMILIVDCIDQIIPYAKLGREIGVDYAVIKQCSEREGVEHQYAVTDLSDLEDVIQEAESYATSNYAVIVKRKKMEYNERQYRRCYGCEFLPQINGAGDVYCCGNFFGNRDYYIGNICEESFKDIVFGERYKEVMTLVKSKVNVQRQCGEKCRQNEINEFLWNLKSPPPHVNFV